MSKLKIAVIFGGVSSEHDISLISATNVIQNLSPEKYEIIPVGITKKGRWLYYPGEVVNIASGKWDSHPDCVPCAILPDSMYKGIVKIEGDEISTVKVDAVFPVLHGKNGEDGTIQGLLDMSQIPYVGCGCLASACCMDKSFTHMILDKNGIRTAKYRVISQSDISSADRICAEIASELGFPIFVKPARSGSSMGVNKASDIDDLINAVKLAFAHDNKVICEEFIDGRELECAVLGSDSPFASQVGEILPCNDFYDYDAKYIMGTSGLDIPANIPEEASREIRETAVKAFRALNCSGLSRVDFFLKKDGTVILNEINTMPGFTPISMYPKLMENMGISYSELLDRLISLALEK
ncbi:MAG: D-alanine--D-alanine ligase family protein [Oscillospiraceae bacterium]